jgi:large subunit ribosomal protein LP0
MSLGDKRAAKAAYFEKFEELLKTHNSIFIVNVDNVGSNQMHQIRQSLRGEATVLMGKNTMVRRALKALCVQNSQYEKLIPHVRGNIGFVFTNGDLRSIRDKIVANRVAAPARAGAIAPIDVWVPAGNTGMEPGKTSFFQALGVPTKITRGTIEITSDVHLVKVGEKVGASEATLLNMLNISPFTYGMTVVQVYDNGTIFSPSILDVTEEQLLESYMTGVKKIAALSLAIGYPTVAAVPHAIINGYKKLLAISVATDYTFAGSEQASIWKRHMGLNVCQNDDSICVEVSMNAFKKKNHSNFFLMACIHNGILKNMVFIYETNVMFPFLCRLKLIWLIHLPLLWLLQLLLLQLKHQLLNKKRKRKRNLMKIWALVCLTKHVNFSIGNMSIIACPIKPNTFASSYLYILCVCVVRIGYLIITTHPHTRSFSTIHHTHTHTHTPWVYSLLNSGNYGIRMNNTRLLLLV